MAAAAAAAAADEALKNVRMWSQLPPEILGVIFIKLPFIDYIHAGAVCVSWHHAAISSRNLRHSSPRFPSLLFSQDLQTPVHTLLTLDDSKFYNVHLPIAKTEDQYLGSFQEWLMLKNRSKGEIFLLNIISQSRIQLPQNAHLHRPCSPSGYDTMLFTAVVSLAREGILSSAPTSDDCIVVVIVGPNNLAFCRLGNPRWILFKPCQPGQSYDVSSIRFHGGCLHAICSGLQHIVCELDDPPKFTMFDTHPSLQITENDHNYMHYGGIRLVESSTELLLILKLTYNEVMNYEDDNLKTYGFYVFKMDPTSPTTRWVKVESLGDGMLFLGDRSSNSFAVRGLPGFSGNCVYFIENFVDYYLSKSVAAVFSLEDCSIKTLISKRVMLPLMWFML